jgi:hypothetical protein
MIMFVVYNQVEKDYVSFCSVSRYMNESAVEVLGIGAGNRAISWDGD